MIRCYKTRFFLWNTNNTDRNGVNKQNTHTSNTQRKITLQRVSCPLAFFKTNPPIFLGKIWTPPPLPFFLNFENSIPHFWRGWGMLYLFQVKKLLLHFLYKKQVILAEIQLFPNDLQSTNSRQKITFFIFVSYRFAMLQSFYKQLRLGDSTESRLWLWVNFYLKGWLVLVV